MLVVKSVDPPSTILPKHAVLQAAWYPSLVIVKRVVKKKGTRTTCGKALHLTIPLALSRPAAVERARLRKQIYIEIATTRMSEKMPSVRGKCVFSKDLPDRFIDSWKTANTRTISFHELRN